MKSRLVLLAEIWADGEKAYNHLHPNSDEGDCYFLIDERMFLVDSREQAEGLGIYSDSPIVIYTVLRDFEDWQEVLIIKGKLQRWLFETRLIDHSFSLGSIYW